jgi:ABC-type multidrug transport system fused ATPase/permease subunit
VTSLRRAIGVIPQETVLFNDTIGYNIAYGNMSAPESRIQEVIRNAKLESVIRNLPLGMETLVGERGMKLSGGEKQRVSIARAMLKDSPILLCDEPTSSLDTATEYNIMQELTAIGRGRTTVIVAHRLSTVKNADLIIVMDQGRMVQQGTHHELLEIGGKYAELIHQLPK